jgi:hypothetical protein
MGVPDVAFSIELEEFTFKENVRGIYPSDTGDAYSKTVLAENNIGVHPGLAWVKARLLTTKRFLESLAIEGRGLDSEEGRLFPTGIKGEGAYSLGFRRRRKATIPSPAMNGPKNQDGFYSWPPSLL